LGFTDFRGNAEVVRRLRQMLARDRFPHAVILAGARGAGKYTLAQMLAKAMNCRQRPLTPGADSEEDPLPDFCGQCANCQRIAQADDLEARVAEAIEARESLRESEKRETRIFVQTHADVMIIPPDPPQMMVKVDQVRHVTASVYFKPAEGRQKVYIFPESAFIKEAANALLKVLEEPPQFATIFLLAENPAAFLPTIRSRCIAFRLAPLGLGEIEEELKQRADWTAAQRTLVARLSGGAVGRARGFDLDAYLGARHDALLLLRAAFPGMDHAELFRVTESYRAGAEGRERTEQLILGLYSLLRDLLAVQSQTPDLVRNIDILPDLERLAGGVNFAWVAAAAERVGEVQGGMRRNLLRSLSLDAMAASLEI
jgi:DNA polymerase-3 subunit delta'